MKKSRLSLFLVSIAMVMSLTACGGETGLKVDVSGDNSTAYYGASVDSYGDMNTGLGSLTPDMSSSSNSNYSGFDGSSKDEVYYESENYDAPSDIEKPSIDDSVTSSNVYETKLIYSANVELETLDFDNSYTGIKQLIDKYDGFIESESFSNSGSSYLKTYRYEDSRAIVKRQVNLLIRIPTANYDAFNNENEALGNLINKTSNVENITQTYYDTTAQAESLEIQLARLQDMMKSAVDYNDLILLNQEITDVEYRLNSMKTAIRTMDMDVAYSYISVVLKEVVEYSDIEEVEKDTFFNRLKDTIEESAKGFGKFVEELLFAVIMLVPYLVILAVIVIIVRVIFKKQLKEYKEVKKLEKQALMNILSNKEDKKKTTENNNKTEEVKDETKK